LNVLGPAFSRYPWLSLRTFGRSECYPGVYFEHEDEPEHEHD